MSTAVREYRIAIPFRDPSLGDVRRVTLLEGPSGWGECSPLPGYPCAPETARRAAEEAASGAWPPAVRDRVEVNALVPALPPQQAASAAARAVAAGFRTVKVKTGTPGDVDRIAAVRDAVGPAVRLRVDSNGSWDLETAISTIDRLAAFDLELVEQPVETLDDLARLRRHVRVPVAADESVRSVDDASRLAALEAADAVVIKVQCVGGVRAAIDVAEAANVPVIVSSLYETSIGVAAGLALAAALPDLPFACGLGTVDLLAGDVVAEPLVAVDGILGVRRPVPDPDLLARYEDRS